MKRSLRSRALPVLLKIAGVKRMSRLPIEDFRRRIAKGNRHRGYRMKRKKFPYETDHLIDGKWHCLEIRSGSERAERAILYFFGGGMLMDADRRDLNVAKELADASGCDVWFAFYPLCHEHDIEENIRMGFSCYRMMIDIYGAGNVSTCGASSGGMMALAIGLYNNACGRPLPMPRQIVAISPGEVPVDEEERQRMETLNDRDPMVDISFMTRI